MIQPLPKIGANAPAINGLPRRFNTLELQQIKELMGFMSSASPDVRSWNSYRDEAKGIWPEKIITAVDGMRKWLVRYDKPTKTIYQYGLEIR
jgi:hypothetical protein